MLKSQQQKAKTLETKVNSATSDSVALSIASVGIRTNASRTTTGRLTIARGRPRSDTTMLTRVTRGATMKFRLMPALDSSMEMFARVLAVSRKSEREAKYDKLAVIMTKIVMISLRRFSSDMRGKDAREKTPAMEKCDEAMVFVIVDVMFVTTRDGDSVSSMLLTERKLHKRFNFIKGQD